MTRTATLAITAAISCAALSIQDASAAEFQVDGFYRARVRVFDDLSLDKSLANRDGTAFYAEHRLWVRPSFLISDKVSVHADVLGFNNLPWGRAEGEVETYGLTPALFDESLTAPTSNTLSGAPLLDITLWRAWGEINTDVGRFSFGRMPLHWGMGIFQNDGLGLNAEYGDTADRLQWDLLVQDEFYVRLAADVNAEGYVNANDDTYALTGALAYRNEKVAAGLQAQLRRTPSRSLNIVTLDGSFDAELGPVTAHAEVVGQLGSGDLDADRNDVSISALGAAAEARFAPGPWFAELVGGVASGDGDLTDSRVHTFSFDRDFNVGIIMFEQAMPTLSAAAGTDANQNRSYDEVLLGNTIQNAYFARPTFGWELTEGVAVYGSVLVAQTMKLPASTVVRKGYGQEFQAGVRFDRIEHVEIDLRGAYFRPGTYFRNAPSDVSESYKDSVLGAQLTAKVKF